jgi:hypothetical protein
MKPSEVVERAFSHQGSNTNSLVIVALPKEDDYVNKISSEKVAHMTLLFLGEDASQVKNLAQIIDFTKHAADTSLTRFSLEVDRREALGPDEADTLIFSKTRWSGFNEINDYRSYLLKDDNIRIAYESATQFPEWVPHITLGYPDTPANPDNRDYPGIRYVEFDKIAVWFADYDGVEFPLKAYDWELDMAMSTSEIVDRVLSHHGVMGMKWGRRTGGSSSGGSPSRAEKKIQKQDRKLEKVVSSKRKSNELKAQLHNSTIQISNRDADRINRKPEYVKAYNSGELKNPKSPVAKKYVNEINQAYLKNINEQLSGFTNASGTKKIKATIDHSEWLGFSVKLEDIKHDDSNILKVEYIRDANGWITGFKLADDSLTQSAIVVEDILSHHGIKGMKWGVRRRDTGGPQAVVVRDKGKGLKTSGGQGHPAHPDAIRSRKASQVVKKSGTKALSDQELNDFVKRIDLEQRAKRAQYSTKNPAQKFVAKVLGQTGKNTVQNAANDVAAQQVRKHLVKASLLAL